MEKIDQVIMNMKQSLDQARKPIGNKEVRSIDPKEIEPVKPETPKIEEIALIEPYSRKHKTGVKLIDSRMRAILLKLAEKYFFYDAVSAKAGIYRARLSEELSRNKPFEQSFAYARHKFIAYHQELLLKYARNKKEEDWRAEKYILTIADKEYSERKYLTDAVSNQDAKILLMIKAEQLTLAQKAGMEMLKDVKTVDTTEIQPEGISLLPFDTKEVKKSIKKGKKKKPSIPQSF